MLYIQGNSNRKNNRTGIVFIRVINRICFRLLILYLLYLHPALFLYLINYDLQFRGVPRKRRRRTQAPAGLASGLCMNVYRSMKALRFYKCTSVLLHYGINEGNYGIYL